MATEELSGPVSYLVVEFPGSHMTGQGLDELIDLVGRGPIRILDLVFVAKAEDGTLPRIELKELHNGEVLDATVFGGVSSGLVDDSDIADVQSVIEPGSGCGHPYFREPLGGALGERPQGRRCIARRRRLCPERRPPCLARRRRAGGWTTERGSGARVASRAAPTAVIAGTATAVSNRVSRRQANRWAGEEQGASAYPQAEPPAAPLPSPPSSPPASSTPDLVTQLNGLADLRDRGVLTVAEFEAQKANLLGTS